MTGHPSRFRFGSARDDVRGIRQPARLLGLAFATMALALLVVAPAAFASKQVVDVFGSAGSLGGQFANKVSGVAVNSSGAGPANAGDLYVLDPGGDNGLGKVVKHDRLERFGRDDNGTPADPADDTYFFISAWGADVDSTPTGGADYEICTVAADCKPAVASGGNGTQAGNGALDDAHSVAVDQDTGDVYVSDRGNSRVNVYAGDGAFLRSFGYDVVESGPDQVTGPDEHQKLTVKASGGRFSLLFEGETTGATGMGKLATGSKVIRDVETTHGTLAVGQVISMTKGGAFPPGTVITVVDTNQLTVSKAATSADNGPGEFVAHDLPYNATPAEIQTALNDLPTIGGAGGSVTVTGGPGDEAGTAPYTIAFGGTLGGRGVPSLTSSTADLSTSSGPPSATIETPIPGGAYEVCEAGADICRAGSRGVGAGALGEPVGAEGPPFGIAVSPPDGNPASGTVFLADGPNRRVDTFGLDGSSPSSFGSGAVFDEGRPNVIAVDSRGIVYASNQRNVSEIERYDTENANGDGVGFLDPIPAGVNEVQEVTVAATAGTFRLSFEGQSTGDLPFDAQPFEIREALSALPSLELAGFDCCDPRGPGDATGSKPYGIAFVGKFSARNVEQLTVSNGTIPLSGGAGASVATTTESQPGLLPGGVLQEELELTSGLVVDPDSDGPGPDADALYVNRLGLVQQFGPVNAPGLTAPPTGEDDRHATALGAFGSIGDMAIDEASNRLYVPTGTNVSVLGEAGPPPTATLDSLSDGTSHSVIAHATIDPNGPPDTSYRFEYSTDGVNWGQTPTKVLGHQEDPQSVDELINPPPAGLLPNTSYQVRLVFVRKFASAITTGSLSFSTDPAKPLVETNGTSVRTTTTAQLQGRVDPNGSAATYHFEYGNQGPCDANPCASTPERPAGSGTVLQLAAEGIEGLEPNTTYHYRLVADNGTAGSATAGEDRTVSTRASDAPLTHGHFPGPPGSDRAWELVSVPDSGGNPVAQPLGFSDDGNHAAYQVAGGTPISEAGSLFGLYYSERTPTGWKSSLISPKRDLLVGPSWYGLYGNFADFSSLVSINGGNLATGELALWHLNASGQATELFNPLEPQEFATERAEGAYAVSADASRTIMVAKGGTLDPAYPAAAASKNLYDISSGSPQLASLLPGSAVSPCGVDLKNTLAVGSIEGQSTHWLSADGSHLFFPSCGVLYVRDLEADETKPIGPGALLKSTPGAAFFLSTESLDPDDGGGNDVYRYDVGSGIVECLTCVAPGLNANVDGNGPDQVTVSDDGSRVYFSTSTRLLAGAPAGSSSTYSLDVATDKLSYVAPGVNPSYVDAESAFSSTGRFFAFASSRPDLNPLGGALTNGGTTQYYLYDDAQRSLTCVTCPADGSAPLGGPQGGLLSPYLKSQSNLTPLADDGTFAFATTTPLVGADQNTPGVGQNPQAGTDVYEWRDGRQLLVSDGLNNWSGGIVPDVVGVSPSGHDVYFAASTQYTPDALDAFRRFYDARIGGGISFPPPPKPCPLEVCQGTPKGAPEEQAPGTGTFVGPGNVAGTPPARCRKGKVRRKGRCVAKKSQRAKKHAQSKRANHDRRNAR